MDSVAINPARSVLLTLHWICGWFLRQLPGQRSLHLVLEKNPYELAQLLGAIAPALVPVPAPSLALVTETAIISLLHIFLVGLLALLLPVRTDRLMGSVLSSFVPMAALPPPFSTVPSRFVASPADIRDDDSNATATDADYNDVGAVVSTEETAVVVGSFVSPKGTF